jgi:hypothetical protein
MGMLPVRSVKEDREERPREKPRKKLDGPVPFLRNKVPGGMKNG